MSPSRKVRVLLIGSSVVAGLILVYYFAISSKSAGLASMAVYSFFPCARDLFLYTLKNNAD